MGLVALYSIWVTLCLLAPAAQLEGATNGEGKGSKKESLVWDPEAHSE